VAAFVKAHKINVEAENEYGSIAAHVTPAMVEAAQNATGYDGINAHDVGLAQEEWCNALTPDLRKLLRSREREFERAGGRGSALADEIDRMRIALAVRSRSRKKAA
jgi:hypothetical protein